MEKLFFVSKMYGLTKTDIDLLANSNNHRAMFPEYSKNIPRKNISGIPRNIVRL